MKSKPCWNNEHDLCGGLVTLDGHPHECECTCHKAKEVAEWLWEQYGAYVEHMNYDVPAMKWEKVDDYTRQKWIGDATDLLEFLGIT